MPNATLDLAGLADAFASLANTQPVSTAIGVADPDVVRYARTLEYGSIAGRKPWPSPGAKTVLAINPETGQAVVVSAQAPQGFIRTNLPGMMQTLIQELDDAGFSLDAESASESLKQATRSAAAAAVDILHAAAPKDSGKLAQSLVIIDGD